MACFYALLDFAALILPYLEWDWDDVPLCLWAAMWDHQMSGAARFFKTLRAAHDLYIWRPRPRWAWEAEGAGRFALLDWSDDGRRASFSLGYLSGIELRGIVVMLCDWLLIWAGVEARPVARELLARSLRWRSVSAGRADVSFNLIQRTLHTLALESHHLHRWLIADGYRPRHGHDPRAFPLQALHEFSIRGRCIARMIAGYCSMRQPCAQCSTLIGCPSEQGPDWKPECLLRRATAALRSDSGLSPEEVWHLIGQDSSVFPYPLLDITVQVPYSSADWALMFQLRPLPWQ